MELSKEIQTFVKKHNISLINSKGRFTMGHDPVFGFLAPDASCPELAHACQNIVDDTRLTQKQKTELSAIIGPMWGKKDKERIPSTVTTTAPAPIDGLGLFLRATKTSTLGRELFRNSMGL